MTRRMVGDVLGALDDERIALRVKIALLKEQGGNCAEIQDGSERLMVLNGEIRKLSGR